MQGQQNGRRGERVHGLEGPRAAGATAGGAPQGGPCLLPSRAGEGCPASACLAARAPSSSTPFLRLLCQQAAAELKADGNDLYRKRMLKEALHAYEAGHAILGPVSHHEILPAFLEQWRALKSALPANMAAVAMELGRLHDVDKYCTNSLLIAGSAKVHGRRGKARERLGQLGLALHDYEEAARLSGGSGEPQQLLEAARARLGSDANGFTRHQWQKDWADDEPPGCMQEGMKVLLAWDHPGGDAVRWGDLKVRPGPGSDFCWEDVSDDSAKRRFEATSNFERACLMLHCGTGGGRWTDPACALEWLLHLRLGCCTLSPAGSFLLGCLLLQRGWPGDVAMGQEMLELAASGEHNHAFCDYYIGMLPRGPVHFSCTLEMPDVRQKRGDAIAVLAGLQK